MYSGDMGRLDQKTSHWIEYPSPYNDSGPRDLTLDSHGRMWYGAQPYFKVGYVRVRSDAEMAAAK